MRSFALLGAPKTSWPLNLPNQLKQAQSEGNILIGVDRGSLLLKEMGLAANLAVGDFDSLKKSELFQVEKAVPDVRYSVPEKDLTDTELALWYAFEDYQVEFLTLVGATGGRLDHFLANLFMVLKPQFRQYAEKLAIMDQQNLIRFFNAGKHTVKKMREYNYFGVISLTAIEGLNISGAKYNLGNYSNTSPVSLSSNEFLPNQDTFKLSFKKGLVAVIQSRDIIRYPNI